MSSWHYLEVFCEAFNCVCWQINEIYALHKTLKTKKVPNALAQSLRFWDVLPTGLDYFWFLALPVRNPFPAQTYTFPNGWLNPPLLIRFFITQSFTLPSIIETRQAAPHPNSTSTNMAELCMLSCGKRDSLQSGCDLHNLCSPRHQCDPSCNSSQSPLHPLPRPAGMS